MEVPSWINLADLGLGRYESMRLHDGALEFVDDFWAARVSVDTDPDDKDGLVDSYALFVAQKTTWTLICEQHELVVGEWARIPRSQHDPGRRFSELLASHAGKRKPFEIGVDVRALHKLVTALGSNGPVALTATGPGNAIHLRPLPLTSEPAWEAFMMPYELR